MLCLIVLCVSISWMMRYWLIVWVLFTYVFGLPVRWVACTDLVVVLLTFALLFMNCLVVACFVLFIVRFVV